MSFSTPSPMSSTNLNSTATHRTARILALALVAASVHVWAGTAAPTTTGPTGAPVATHVPGGPAVSVPSAGATAPAITPGANTSAGVATGSGGHCVGDHTAQPHRLSASAPSNEF